MKKIIIIAGMVVLGSLIWAQDKTTAQNGQDSLVIEFERLSSKKTLTNEEYERFVELSGKIEIKEEAKKRFQEKFEVRFVKKTPFSTYLKEEFLHPSRGMEVFEGLAVVGLTIFLLLKGFRRI